MNIPELDLKLSSLSLSNFGSSGKRIEKPIEEKTNKSAFEALNVLDNFLTYQPQVIKNEIVPNLTIVDLHSLSLVSKDYNQSFCCLENKIFN